ncbi:MAG: hypothetical protein Kow00121_66460 [Elainellaceae cyanobacterium]
MDKQTTSDHGSITDTTPMSDFDLILSCLIWFPLPPMAAIAQGTFNFAIEQQLSPTSSSRRISAAHS